MHWFEDELNDRRRRGLYRRRRRLRSSQGATVRLSGRDLINFASNDYLNLAADPRLARAAARAARRYGCGAGASPLVSGLLLPLQALERALAEWEGTEAALVFSSGFAANLAVLTTLVGRADACFSDALNHASLIDGCRLSRAAVHIYRHNDVAHLDSLLSELGPGARRRLIVTDTVFSMDGDLAPLPDLLALAERHDCLLVADEAHATGVLGEHGRGASELLLKLNAIPNPQSPIRTLQSAICNPQSEWLIKIGTLSKALGAQGGFVCGSRALIDWLINSARPYIFSTALAPPTAAAARRAVRVVREEPERRRQVLALAASLRALLLGLGFPQSTSSTQIVPVVIGAAAEAVELSRRLQDHGLLVPAIRPPSVPEGSSRLRITLTAGHTEEHLQRLAEALGALAKRPRPHL
jgi:7-keto-8-aminopelargonate synthetase-like enzyme